MVAACRLKLRETADQIRSDVAGRGYMCRRSMEWQNMPVEHRMAVMLLSGIDGDLGQLARRAWVEFTPDEKLSVQVTIRGLRTSLAKAFALGVKAV